MSWQFLITAFRLIVALSIVGALDLSMETNSTAATRRTDSIVMPPSTASTTQNQQQRIAMIITLAGNRKLAPYFEWGCRTIGTSKDLVDMIVFHENNQQLEDMKCAENVKFINLGERGLSELIAKHIMGEDSNEDIRKQLVLVISNVLLYTPRYLVEIKPMSGTLFHDYISHYSHWTYSDPDIVWGNLSKWIDRNDLPQYDIVSFAKHFDAARLYLRGQFSVHRNVDGINSLWKKLSYFQHDNYASRMGTAYRMLTEHAPADEVFKINFQSAEGWYSNLVFNQPLKVKIVGMAFDDFFREPVVWVQGNLARCPVTQDLAVCIRHVTESVGNNTGVTSIPAPKYEPAIARRETTECKMRWLPVETRFCLTEAVYDKADALSQDKQDDVKLARTGETVLEKEQWLVNNEETAPRQIREWGAFFHFRHWDDAISLRHEVTWPNTKDGSLNCMVLYLKANHALAFEDCDAVANNEKLGRQTLGYTMKTKEGKQPVKEVLARARWEMEVGYHSDRSSKKKKAHLEDAVGEQDHSSNGEAAAAQESDGVKKKKGSKKHQKQRGKGKHGKKGNKKSQ